VNQDSPNLTDFLLRVFATDLSISIKTDLPPSLSHFVIQDFSQSINCTVFLSQWRTNTGYFKYYNLISKAIVVIGTPSGSSHLYATYFPFSLEQQKSVN
jgi:hypothetical protein